MSAPQSERGITRRYVLERGAILLSPLAAFACTSEAAEREKIKATAYAQSTAQAGAGLPRPTEPPRAPAPTQPPQRQPTQVVRKELPRGLEDQAKQYALTKWFDLLSTPAKIPQIVDTTAPLAMLSGGSRFNIALTNASVWKQRIGDISRSSNYKANPPLEMRWTVAWTAYSNPRASVFGSRFVNIHAAKYEGEMRLDNIRLQMQSIQLSDADRANGIGWRGSVSIEFIRQHRANYVMTDKKSYNGRTSESQPFQDWALGQSTHPLPPTFSPWENDTWSATVQLKQGNWEEKLDQPYIGGGGQSHEGEGAMYGTPLPVRIIDPNLGKTLCNTAAQSPCRLIEVKI